MANSFDKAASEENEWSLCAAEEGRDRALNPDGIAFLERCDKGLSIALQPIYALEAGSLYGFEALTRGWRELESESAHALFDVAKRLDVLPELEAQQIERAIEMLAAWTGDEQPVLFVNLDSRLLKRPRGLFARASAALNRYGLSRRRLCFEVSERHDQADCVQIEKSIADIRAAGFQIGLDDFGAGVSDIKALYKYDLHFLKIDRFFISGLAQDHRKRFFVASIVELAHLLGQKVIVEGIEREEDLAICRELRCDIGQGFGLATPQTHLAAAPRQVDVETDAEPIESRSAETLEPYTEFLPALPHDMPMQDVLKLFSRLEAPALFPVVGEKHEPVGLVRESSLRSLVHSRYGHELVRNRQSRLALAQFISSCPTVDVGVDPDRLAQLFSNDGVEGVIITSEMRYVGFLPAAKLLRLNAARQLRAAREANPLTHLGGNGVVSGFIADVACASGADRIFCYFDFDNFKPFNDHYGFALGDRAILLFSNLLKQAFQEPNTTLGHIGGDDFFAGVAHVSWEQFRPQLCALLERFRHEAESLYSPEDRAAGGVFALDREGREQFFPMLRCSAGVLHAPQGRAYKPNEISTGVAALKKAAKAAPDGMAYRALTGGESADGDSPDVENDHGAPQAPAGWSDRA